MVPYEDTELPVDGRACVVCCLTMMFIQVLKNVGGGVQYYEKWSYANLVEAQMDGVALNGTVVVQQVHCDGGV